MLRKSWFVRTVIAVGWLNSTVNTSAQGPPAVLQPASRNVRLGRFEFSPFIANVIGDKLSNFLQTGARVDLRLNPSLAIGADFGWSRIAFDATSAVGRNIRDRNLYAWMGVLAVHLPAAFMMGQTLVTADLFGTFGGGVLRVNRSNRGSGLLGGGMKIYFGSLSWLGLRLEVRSYLSSIETVNGSSFSSDFAVILGPSFRLPPML